MAHVGQLGTFLLPAWRRHGVGQALFEATRHFAVSAAYRKFVIQVRASNAPAQAFYKKLGFCECDRLHAQVSVNGTEDDEIGVHPCLTASGVALSTPSVQPQDRAIRMQPETR